MQSIDIQETSALAARFLDRAVFFLPQLVAAGLILVAGLFLARWIGEGMARAFQHSTRIGETVRAPLISIVRYVVVIFTVILALGQLGVQTTSLLAVLGAAGLAVGLALQGTLTNIAAGIMLLWLRPFRVGDYIETQTFSGTVREIGLFVCHLETYDGLFVFAPNSAIWNVWLKNHTRAGPRIVAWTVELKRDLPDAVAACTLAPDALHATGLDRIDASLDQLTPDAQVLLLRGTVREGSIAEALRLVPHRIRTALVERFGPDGDPRSIHRLVPGDSDPSRFLGVDEAPKANAALVNARPEAADQGAVATVPR
jgi:small conductance mechanosensitive channel